MDYDTRVFQKTKKHECILQFNGKKQTRREASAADVVILQSESDR